jgi:hypothetical protein
MGLWLVTYLDPDLAPLRVRAAYATETDRSMPGRTVLKDHRHKTVAAVPTDKVLSIERVAEPEPAPLT